MVRCVELVKDRNCRLLLTRMGPVLAPRAPRRDASLLMDLIGAYGKTVSKRDARYTLMHVVLPAALAADADIFEARLRHGVYAMSASPAGFLSVFDRHGRMAHDTAVKGVEGMLGGFARFEVQVAARDMLDRLVRCGMRDAAHRLARVQLGPAPRNTPFITPDMQTAGRPPLRAGPPLTRCSRWSRTRCLSQSFLLATRMLNGTLC